MRGRSSVVRSMVLALLSSLSFATAAIASEITLLAGSAITPAMQQLIPEFERSSGDKISADLDGTVGAMTSRVLGGEAADLIIVSGPQIDKLEAAGKVTTGSRVDIAKVGVGLFIRRGASRPDIATVESFKQVMLGARSIGWNDPAAGAPVSLYLLGAFERLGIADAMKPKTVAFKQRSERFAAVARGDVEIGFNQISEILAAPGVELVGPLPAEIQRYTLFSAGIVSTSPNKDKSAAFIRFLATPAALAVWKAKGFEAP